MIYITAFQTQNIPLLPTIMEGAVWSHFLPKPLLSTSIGTRVLIRSKRCWFQNLAGAVDAAHGRRPGMWLTWRPGCGVPISRCTSPVLARSFLEIANKLRETFQSSPKNGTICMLKVSHKMGKQCSEDGLKLKLYARSRFKQSEKKRHQPICKRALPLS